MDEFCGSEFWVKKKKQNNLFRNCLTYIFFCFYCSQIAQLYIVEQQLDLVYRRSRFHSMLPENSVSFGAVSVSVDVFVAGCRLY